jgi:arylsulfatase A-like enzyme
MRARWAATLAGVLLVIASCNGGTRRDERKPNIVFILTDDQSVDSVAHMPFVHARTDWITFQNAFLNLPLCCPSRATLLSGLSSHHHGVEDNVSGRRFDASSTVATWLHGAGYRTALIGKYLNRYPFGRRPFVPPGWDEWAVFRAEPAYFDYQLFEDGKTVSYGTAAEDYVTDVLAKKAVAFIERQAPEPFFLYFSPNAPHGTRTNDPPIPAPRHVDADFSVPRPPSFNEEDVSDKPAVVRSFAPVSSELADAFRRAQYRTLLAVDDAVRDIFRALERRKLLDRTVIAFMSDNGFSFGEHRILGKGCEYEECIRTPLLVRHPNAQGRVISELISNVDIAPTFADIADTCPGAAVDGRSFLPLIHGKQSPSLWRTALLIRGRLRPFRPEDPGFWGLRTQRFTYVEHPGGERELYELQNDPYQLQNVSGTASFAEEQAGLADELARQRAAVPSRIRC